MATRALTSHGRGILATGVAIVVAITLAVVTPSIARAQDPADPQADPGWRDKRLTAWTNRGTPATAVRVQKVAAAAERPGTPSARPPTVVWPAAGSVAVDVPAGGSGGPAAWVSATPGGLPVRLTHAVGSAQPSPIRLEVLDRAAAAAAGVHGLLLRIVPERAGADPVRLQVGYRAFAHAYGGDWASRLRLVRLPACAATTAHLPQCQSRTPLGSRNDTANGTVTATVSLADGGELVALSAAPAGPAGDWSATSLAPAATWQVSTQTGDFSWSYPMRVPPAVGGPQPRLSLSYSSGSADGRVASTNNQTSWIGDGWELSSGYVERKYASCADDDSAGANNVGHETGDLCWKSDNATLSLNGRASELVKDEATGAWRLKDDDGTRVQRLAGAWNSDNDSEYWKVTTVDGTQYFFGRDQRSATDTTKVYSAWTVPVSGNHPGEPCYDSSFASSFCIQAWRWNLDYVVDPHGNTMTYFYSREWNHYGRNLNESTSSYVRGGYLARIEYGERVGSEATTTAPMRVDFGTDERCLTDCSTLDDSTKANWPDTPYDLICDSTTSCPEVMSPAFFTRKRLVSVTTKVWNGSAYDNVDSWALTHTFPDPGDGISNPVLWLNSIEHKGLRGGTVTLPTTVFTGVQLPNRVDTAGDLGPAMIRYRVMAIDTESGGRFTVNYDPPDCSPTSLPAAPESNTRRCMPIYWLPEGYSDPILEYFHKYRVSNVVTDPDPVNPGDPEVVTRYGYGDNPAWHYDDNELVPAKRRTWGEFRGYGTVDVSTGSAGAQTRTRHRFFRGMDRDRLPDGGRRNVTVDGIDDHDRYSGMTREEVVYDGAGGAEVTATASTPWRSPATATGTDGTQAFLSGVAVTETRTTAPALPGGTRRTRKVVSFDDTYGMPTQVDDQGDLATADDDLCTRYEYARNTGLYIVDTEARVETVSVACGGPVSRPADVVDDTRHFFDGSSTFGAAPTRGLVTRVEQVASYDGATPVYVVESTTAYDVQGRTTSVTDALGRTTTTGYTPASGGPLTRTAVTSPDPDGSGSLTAHVTTTDLDPALGVAKRMTDPNGKVTEAAYDPLGRLWKVWLPGRTTSQTPNLEYAYLVRANGPNAVTTKRLIHDGSQQVSIQLFDGLMRERQTQSTALGDEGGRVITDTRYDERGQAAAVNHGYYDPGTPSTDLVIPSTIVPGRTETVYDGAGRVTAQILLKNGVEQWRSTLSYGGDRVTVDPPDGGTPTTTISDARGRTTALWRYLGGSPAGAHQDTLYRYDHGGRLATVSDPAGNQWSYGYDLRGRQTSAVDPDRGAVTSVYDDAGQLTSTTDVGRGLTLAYRYDQLGRRIEMRDGSVAGALRATWSYDTLAKGQLTSSTRYAGTAQYVTAVTGYDDGYRPLGQSVTVPSTGVPTGEPAIAGTYTTTYTYTIDGQLKTVSNPSTGNLGAETVTYYYDAVNQPEWMTGGLGWGVYVAGADWSAYGEPLLLDLGNTYFQHVMFDYEEGTQRLVSQKLLRQNAAGYDLNSSYSHDPAGNVKSIIDQAVGAPTDAQCFRYDGLRRVTEAWTPSSADCASDPVVAALGGSVPYWTSYTYDPAGNRDTETRHTSAGDTVRDYVYPAAGGARPHAVTRIDETGPGGARTYTYGYDPAGDTVCRPTGATGANVCPSGTGSQALTWDAEGKLVGATSGGQTSGYLYTADGERLLRREAGVTTVYLPGGQELRLTVSTGAKATLRYYTFAGATVAVRTGGGLSGVSTLVADHHGTAEISVANTTNVLTRRRHDPFGNPRGSVPSWPGDHGFLDKPRDATGLTHIGAREYDPGIGRFVSVDPLMDLADPEQWHGYAYANNNPVAFSDPTGMILTGDDEGKLRARPSHDGSEMIVTDKRSSDPRKHTTTRYRRDNPTRMVVTVACDAKCRMESSCLGHNGCGPAGPKPSSPDSHLSLNQAYWFRTCMVSMQDKQYCMEQARYVQELKLSFGEDDNSSIKICPVVCFESTYTPESGWKKPTEIRGAGVNLVPEEGVKGLLKGISYSVSHGTDLKRKDSFTKTQFCFYYLIGGCYSTGADLGGKNRWHGYRWGFGIGFTFESQTQPLVKAVKWR